MGWLGLAGGCAATLALGGCATAPSQPAWDARADRVCGPAGCYRVGPLDAAWTYLAGADGHVTFFNGAATSVIQSNATCRRDVDAAPLRALTSHLLIGYTESHVRHEVTLPMARREALHTVVDVKLDGVPMVLDLLVLKRNGCVFDLSYAAPPSAYELGLSAFARFVGGFTDERPPP
jgi:hypothetical protein